MSRKNNIENTKIVLGVIEEMQVMLLACILYLMTFVMVVERLLN